MLGEKGLIRQAGELEKEYGDICRKIRDVIAGSYSHGRDVSKAIRLISLMQGISGMSKILAEDEELYNFAEDTAGTCDEGLLKGMKRMSDKGITEKDKSSVQSYLMHLIKRG